MEPESYTGGPKEQRISGISYFEQANTMKAYDLCERPYCREPWCWRVCGRQEHWRRTWQLRVCDEHVQPYIERLGDLSPGGSLTVRARGRCEPS
jgi:hypothetical protein